MLRWENFSRAAVLCAVVFLGAVTAPSVSGNAWAGDTSADFEIWQKSQAASDLDKDADIDVVDYRLYLAGISGSLSKPQVLQDQQPPPPPPPPPGGDQQPPPGGDQQPPPGGDQQPPPGGDQQPPPGGDQQPPPGGDQQPPPGDGIVLEVLKRIEAAINSGNLADIAIDEFLPMLPDDAARELLKQFAGDDGRISSDELNRAIQALAGGPPPGGDGGQPPPPGGDEGQPPPGGGIVLEILNRIESALKSGQTDVAIDAFLEELPADAQDLLKRFAGEDGRISGEELARAIGELAGGPGGPGPGGDEPGTGGPGPGGPPPGSEIILEILGRIEEALKSGGLADIGIDEFLEELPGDGQELLKRFAGEDGRISGDEIARAIGELAGGPGGPGPGGDEPHTGGPGPGGPPPGSEIILEILGRIEEALKAGDLADIGIDEFLEELPADAQELLKRFAGDDGRISADEIARAIGSLAGGPGGPGDGGDSPGPGGPPAGSEIILEILGRIEEALKAGDLADIGIDEFLEELPGDAQELLKRFAGDDGRISAEEVAEAVQALAGGPGGPGPGGPSPGGEIAVEGVFEDAVLTMSLDLPGLGNVSVAFGLSDDGRQLLGSARTPIGPLNLELSRVEGEGTDNVVGVWEGEVVGTRLRLQLEQDGSQVRGTASVQQDGQPPGPGPGPDDDAPLAAGGAGNIDREKGTFSITLPTGVSAQVITDDQTEFVIQFGLAGGDTPPGPPPIDGGPGPNRGPGGATSVLGLQQPDGGPGLATQPATFEDLQDGDLVEVFGEKDGDTILARRVVILRSGGPDGPGPGPGGDGGTPVAEGSVEAIDVDGRAFSVISGPDRVVRVLVNDETEFTLIEGPTDGPGGPAAGDGGRGIPGTPAGPGGPALAFKAALAQQQPPQPGRPDQPGNPGSIPGGRPASFEDLKVDDFVEVFGTEEDGVVLASLVLIVRAGEPGDGPGTETSIEGEFIDGWLKILVISPLGEVTVVARLIDGQVLEGTASSPLGEVDVRFERLEGEGDDDVSGLWAGSLAGTEVKIRLKQEGTRVRGLLDGGQPPGPGGNPGIDLDNPTASGTIVDIDPSTRMFRLEVGEDEFELVQLSEDTRVFFLPGGPAGQSGGQPQPGQPTGPARQGQSTLTQQGQPGGPGNPGGPGGPGTPGGPGQEQPGSPDGAPASFEDLEIGTHVVVFGERDDEGTILAQAIGIASEGGPGVPDGGGFEPSITSGTVVDIEESSFQIQTEDGPETIEINEDTRFSILFLGAPGGPPRPEPGNPGAGGPQPGQASFGQQAQPGQPGGQPGGSGQQGRRPNDPGEALAFFADLKVDDEVEIFGERDSESGVILAEKVRILRSFDDQEIIDFPVLVGVVASVDHTAGEFVVEEGPFFSTTVLVGDATEFFILRQPLEGESRETNRPSTFSQQGQPGQPGGQPGGPGDPSPGPGPGDGFQPPPLEPAAFEDLEKGDNVDVFGDFDADGAVIATRVVMVREQEPEAPAVTGQVIRVSAEERTLVVEDGETGEAWTVILNEGTRVTELQGNVDGQSKQPGSPQGPQGNQNRPGGQPGQPVGEERPRQFSDLKRGAFVAVFGEEITERTVDASRIVILFGGSVQEAIEFVGQVNFFDQVNGRLNLQQPKPIKITPETEFLSGGQRVASLRDLKALFAAGADFLSLTVVATLEFEAVRIYVNDFELDSFESAGVAEAIERLGIQLDEGQRGLLVNDPLRNIREFDSTIARPGLPPVEVTRKTVLSFPDGSRASTGDLTPGTRIEVSGKATRSGQQTVVVADAVRILGGRSFHEEGIVASVNLDERTISFASPPPEPISSRVRIGDERGRPISLAALRSSISDDPDRPIVFERNKFGEGILKIELLDTDNPKPPKPDQFVIRGGEVAFDEVDGRLVMVLQGPPPIRVPDGTKIEGAAGLAELEGFRVIVEGELIGEARTARAIVAVPQIERIDLEIVVGDFDGGGAEDDVLVTALDPAGEELDVPLVLFLDRKPPQDVSSGTVVENLEQGRHSIRVEAPSLGIRASRDVVIRQTVSTFSVVSTDPEDGATGVASGQTELRVTFSDEIKQQGRFIDANVIVKPRPPGGVRKDKMSLENNGTILVIPLELEEGASYTLSVTSARGPNNQSLNRPVTVAFSTGATVEELATITGTIELSALLAAAKQAGDESGDPVELISGEVIAVDGDRKEAGRGSVDEDGGFELMVPGGNFVLFVNLETSEGRTSGFLDADGDGAPDGVVAVAGETSEEIVITVDEPEPVDDTEDVVLAEVAAYTGAEAPQSSVFIDPYTVELELLESEEGEILFAAYIDGATDLSAFDVLVQYDPTALTFVEVLKGFDGIEDDGEGNILEQNDGFALGITDAGESSVNWSVALLGPLPSQLVSDRGVVGIFRFLVNESLFDASSAVVPQIVLEVAEGTVVLQPFVGVQTEGEGVTRQIVVSSDEATIVAGSGQATITAELFDLDGFAFDEDDTSELTFLIADGPGKVNGEDATTITVTGGKAEVTLSANDGGTIQVRISAEGAGSALVEVEATTPPEIGEGPVGPIALDLDVSQTGDQGVRRTISTPAVGDEVVVELVATEGANGLIAFSAALAYDKKLEYVGFSATDLFEGGLPIPVASAGAVRISVAFVTSATTTSASGTLGLFTFKVLEEGEARVTLVSGRFATGPDPVKLSIGSGGSVVGIGGGSSGLTPSDGDGTWSMDLDDASGDQKVRELSGVGGGQEFTVQLINNQSVSPSLGGSFTIQFDPQKVEPVSGSVSGIVGPLGAPVIEGSTVRFTLASLSGVPVTDGFIGQIGFKTLDSFDGETEIVLLEAAIGDATSFENIESNPMNSVVIRTGTEDGDGSQAGPSPDFDGDGSVGFRDFIQFAQKFGSKDGDGVYAPAFDLDSNGEVGFRDFILFAQSYGKDPTLFVAPKSALSKPVGSPETNRNTSLSLVPRAGNSEGEVKLLVRISEADYIGGYSLRLKYDGSTMEWLGVDGVAPSQFLSAGGVSIVRPEGVDELVLADIIPASDAVKGEGELLQLHFRMLDQTVVGRVDVVQALVADELGNVRNLMGTHIADLRSLPQEFSLGRNFPNPFNPETVLPFSLPESVDVRLVVFNVLGQEVRVLSNGRLEAGFHRIVWNGRDERGRELASGIYLTRMVAGDYVGISKMLLIK